MKLAEFRKLIREEVRAVVYKQQLNEGNLGDFLSRIKLAATKAANNNFDKAVEYIDIEKLKARPIQPDMINKAQKDIEAQSQQLSEGFMDNVRKFATTGAKIGIGGSLFSGITAIGASLEYLDRSFHQWYYQTIQGMAKSDVMKIMIDLYGAKAAEASIWLKLGMYAFFAFFVIALLSIAVMRMTKKNKTL
jgi:hypothetical protein